MSIDQCRDEIRHFLSSNDSEVLVVAGKWGVGKTFAWKRFLKEASQEETVAYDKYSYVSLFGLESLNDLKDAIFQNAVPTNAIDTAPNFATLEGAIETIKANWRQGGWFIRMFPKAESYAAFIIRLGFFALKRQIICIDDLDRKSKLLEMRDILGLVSHLKEEKTCKVALLLNDEKFESDEQEFRNQLEKVADTFVRFEPTPFEASEIGLDGTLTFHEALRANCISLKIVNIRTIKKLEKIVGRLSAELAEFDSRVLKQAIHSVALFECAKLHPDATPSLEFIRAYNPWEGILHADGAEPPNQEWRSILEEYGLTQIDEFDEVLLQGVQCGHFDHAKLIAGAKVLAERLHLQDEDNSFSEAWRLYHDSFDDNAEEVMKALSEAVTQTPRVVTPTNLSGTVTLLKDLQWLGDINGLMQAYIAGRPNETDIWNLDEAMFGGDVKDPDVRKAFSEKCAVVPEQRDAKSLLIELGKRNGYNPIDIQFLASFDVDWFYKLFKELKGVELSRAVRGALWFQGAENNEHMSTLVERAEEALRKIGSESLINRRRVIQHGVSMDDAQAT